MKVARTRRERVVVVLDICKRLKAFPKSDGSGYINLYNSDFEAIRKAKVLFQSYVNLNQNEMCGFSGKIAFPELNRTIEYILPVDRCIVPMFVLRAQ